MVVVLCLLGCSLLGHAQSERIVVRAEVTNSTFSRMHSIRGPLLELKVIEDTALTNAVLIIQYNPEFVPQLTTYESIKASGRLDLIRDFELRNRIVQLYEQYYRFTNTYDQAISEHVRDFVKPFYINEISFDNTGNILGDFLTQQQFRNIIFGYRFLFIDKNEFYGTVREQSREVLEEISLEENKNITLVPMFYQMGGFGKQPEENQRRFISANVDKYLSLLEASQASVSKTEMARLGIGFHSLRAVSEASCQGFFETTKEDLPFHIHVSEQLKEVEDCQSYYGKRPVEWLLENFPVDDSFHLVHATHLNDDEIKGIANKGAHVVLCPST